MNVRKLIEILIQYPMDMPVLIEENMKNIKLKSKAYEPSPVIGRYLYKNGEYYIAKRPCKETSGAEEAVLL